MRNRRTAHKKTGASICLNKMEDILSMMDSEKPIERIRSLEQKISQLKEQYWSTKEVLTTAEVSEYLGLSESYIYKLTASRQIPHYKPNGKLVYFNKKELCEWAMRNHIITTGATPTENGTV